jgi:GNAT superfamily N-acetyltransferase
MHQIREVDAKAALVAWKIQKLNRCAPDIFPTLQARHFRDGFWWFALFRENIVGFAGMVPFLPGTGAPIGYLKRAYVVPSARGSGLQRQFLRIREDRARILGWTLLVSECGAGNIPSANNFLACGFNLFDPEQPWGAPDSIYWMKKL